MIPHDRALRERVHQRLLTDIADAPVDPIELRARLAHELATEAPLLANVDFDRVLTGLVHDVSGLGPLESVLAEPDVNEVMVNGAGGAYVERNGHIEPVALECETSDILKAVERVIAPLGLRLDPSSPIVDARLPDGSRLHAVIAPAAVDGPYLCVRRFRPEAIPLAAFGVAGAAARLCSWMIHAGWNVLVSGATSTGKTTLIRSLSSAVDPTERIVTIEETAELRLVAPHVVRLEGRPANAEGAGAVTVRDLVRASLRMRPDRIIVGEVRGAEALDLLQALNTGHDGSLSTVHANGPLDALDRVATLARFAADPPPHDAVRAQVDRAFDAVVHLARTASGRHVAEIAELRTEGELRTLGRRVGQTLEVVATPQRAPRRAP